MALKPSHQTSRKTLPETATPWSRRLVLKTLTVAGLGTAVFGRALLALAEEGAKVTEEMVRQAEWIAGLDFTDEDRKLLIEDLNQTVAHYEEIRAIPIDNSVPPALRFATVESNDEQAARRDNVVEMTSHPAVSKPASEEALADVDVFVAPSFVGGHLLPTNLTGHPAVVVPNGFRASDGTPTSITFTGRLFRETDVLAVAHAFQQATDFHRKHPPIEKFLQKSKNTG